ncbi:hypothetical protein M5E87_13005 [Flavonifractor plautii]|nr:hypothetical protein M5E87_13005 [Flavonifractor plautii]
MKKACCCSPLCSCWPGVHPPETRPPRGGTPAVSLGGTRPDCGGSRKMTCRIVDGAEEGELVLVTRGRGDVYTLDTEGLAVDGTLADGAMVEVGFDGMILETYPAKFGHVTGVTVLEERG